ncbi:MAG: glycoside hydrolase family 5 protein [Thermoguttaceae bacterium]|nr:glycoside hydrolase family 5 protein [Thermoguttaceae bacterium]MDW8039540.1 glycoside hydrolase family 5 protein [Thermoguttaceae bacterium]
MLKRTVAPDFFPSSGWRGWCLVGSALAVVVWATATGQTPKRVLAGEENRVAGAPIQPDALAQNKRLGRGVNIIGYDPLWRDRTKARFRPEFFRMIREAGFQHVRINLHPFRDNPSSKLDEAGLRPEYLETLDWAVDHALQAGLMVVLDFHEFQAMGKEPQKWKPRYLACWETIAQRQKNRPPEVLFELLNEPNSALTPELWNQLLRETLALIRRSNPHRTVIIGPAQWNNISQLKNLQLPAEDRNIIVTIHYYSPFEFTHQGAAFAGRKDKVGIRWGTERDRQAIVADFDQAQAWATKTGRPLYLGEFGVYDRAPPEDRAAWLSFVTRQAEKRGWSWAYWQFDGDFILYDIRKGQWVEPVLRAILPPETPLLPQKP